jgi:SAM-dependent methyltransferase
MSDFAVGWSTENQESMKSDASLQAGQGTLGVPADCVFYQTICLPGIGVIDGAWDHRERTDAYLGHIDFRRKRVLDVGPANGFFSFEMERRGAEVVAIDLGKEADWDAVPHPDIDVAFLRGALRDNVQLVENAFWFAHKRLNSSVRLIYGSVYDTPNLINRVDVALMSNVLQHFRDPFRAIEQVAKVVGETIIITESLWLDDQDFVSSPSMRLLPNSAILEVNHSWWQVSPTLVIEILKLLSFQGIRCRFHQQRFNGTPVDKRKGLIARSIPHFTVTGTRTGNFRVAFSAGWHDEERSEECVWRWSSHKQASISIKVPIDEACRVQFSFELATIRNQDVQVYFNGSIVWRGEITHMPQPIHLQELELNPGQNFLQINGANEPTKAADNDGRRIGLRISNFNAVTTTRT